MGAAGSLGCIDLERHSRRLMEACRRDRNRIPQSIEAVKMAAGRTITALDDRFPSQFGRPAGRTGGRLVGLAGGRA
jgi:hypothetical protein